MGLNRIYQGRVVSCQDECGNGIDNFEKLLFEHHQLFQDAVNYYLFALVAMAMDTDATFGKIKQQLKDVWDDFYRNGELRSGLKHSLHRIYAKEEILDLENGFEFAKNLVLDNCTVDPEILQAALTHIAEKCSGDVTQPSKTYFPQLCCPSFKGNWDLDIKAYEAAKGKNNLIAALYSMNPLEEIKKLIPAMDIGWCGIKTQTGKFFEGQEALNVLKSAIQFFIDNPTDYVKNYGNEYLLRYLTQLESIGEISFGRNNKADVKRRNAMWLLRFFPDDFTVGLMKSIISEKEKVENLQVPIFGDDPIKLSRGVRGYVFKQFTELQIWQDNTDWRAFAMEAFMEALKTINQFRDKSDARNEECEKYRIAVEWMEGKSALSKSPAAPDSDDLIEEDESNNALPILATDSRWEKLQNLLHNELAVQNCWTDDEVIEYGLSERTIRSFGKLKSLWNKILSDERKKQIPEIEISVKLKKALDKFQTEHSEAMGSAALFQALCKAENICIWDETVAPKEKYRSADILRDTVKYNGYKQKISQLEEPIQITPADSRLSRRMNDIYAINGRKGHTGQNIFIAKLAIKDNGKFKPAKITMHYSAPRLLRDGLKNPDSESFYLPPILQAIFPEQKFEQEFKSAVFLMPDWDRDGKLRLLLNFPTEISVDKLQGHFDQRFRGKNEFYFAQDANCALLWPDYKYKKTPTWFKSGKPFYFSAVDMGQRSAGALVRIKVSTIKEKHSVFLGNDGKNDWYALRVYSELLRLPGENAKVIRNGKFTQEEYGKSGRLADDFESKEAIEIFRLLNEDDNMLYPDGKNIVPYFSMQNDKLLIAMRRAIGKLKILNRWLWMSKDAANSEKIKTEINSADWLKIKTLDNIKQTKEDLRKLLPPMLVKIANRILPVREKTWLWTEKCNQHNIRYWQLVLADSPGCKPKIRGQRGLSFARLTQLEEFRKRCQALNRILMRGPGDAPQSIADMRKMVVPDCCPEVLRRLDEMKEQRINQTANMILMQALGVRHKIHNISQQDRSNKGIHGEYEKIPGVEMSSFVVLENLSRYKFSQDRSPYENSRLMKWAHHALAEKLKMLCEVIGLPVVEVNAAYSSKFSSESIPGFRADECNSADLDNFYRWNKKLSPQANKWLNAICENHKEMCKYDINATSLLPRDGGEIFVPFCGSDDLKQADINAAFNIGLRAVANGKNFLVNNRLSAEKKKEKWAVKRNTQWAKIIYPEEISIFCAAESKFTGGNFFVIGCQPRALGIPDEQTPHFATAHTGFLMFGGSVWHNLELQLERCCKLNEMRLRKFSDKPESLF